MTDTRSCTCHPDDGPPSPCQRNFSLTECKDAEIAALRAERDAARALLREANNWIGRDCTNVREQIAELTPLCNRIDAALKGEKNNGIS